MFKLYFKKILFTFGFITNYFLLAFMLAFVRILVLRNTFSELVNTLIHAILALVLNFVIVFIMRYKSFYHKTKVAKNYSFLRNFIIIFKSKDNIVHALAFISILLPFFMFIAVSEKTPLLPLVVGTIILLFAYGLIFSIVNTLIWCLVYKLFDIKSYLICKKMHINDNKN